MCVIVLFGGSGDLSRKKLIPALYNLEVQGKLCPDVSIFAVARKERSLEEYLDIVKESAFSNSRFERDEKAWEIFSGRISYASMDFESESGYRRLEELVSKAESGRGDKSRIYYMAVSPEYFGVIARNVQKSGMNKVGERGYRRLVIEKPFGSSLESAKKLNREIRSVFPEESIYRIDHYLAKEMIQNIMALRFSNAIFEPIWSSEFIDNIQVSLCESGGVEERGEYYDSSGALRDMVQSHIIQIVSLICMEPPVSLAAGEIKDEKVKVIKHIVEVDENNFDDRVVLGQYSGIDSGEESILPYRMERGVDANSTTETFAALKLEVLNRRWKGTPIYVRTGKRMKEKKANIVVQFKKFSQIYGFEPYGEAQPDILVIKIQPRDGILFQFNMKKPRTTNEMDIARIDYCRSCEYAGNTPKAYERLIEDVIRGDASLFTRWDEIESSWRVIDKILNCHAMKMDNVDFYNPKSMGPDKASELLKKDGADWWDF